MSADACGHMLAAPFPFSDCAEELEGEVVVVVDPFHHNAHYYYPSIVIHSDDDYIGK